MYNKTYTNAELWWLVLESNDSGLKNSQFPRQKVCNMKRFISFQSSNVFRLQFVPNEFGKKSNVKVNDETIKIFPIPID